MVCGFSDSDSSRYSPKIIALSHWICCYGHRFVFVIKCVFFGANTQDNPRGLSKHLAATAAVAVKRMLRANKFIIDRANVRCISFIPQQQQQPSATRAAENKNKKQETRWTEILTRIINKILFQNHRGGGGGGQAKKGFNSRLPWRGAIFQKWEQSKRCFTKTIINNLSQRL